VLLLGSIANNEGPSGRWWFALGACVASVLWFAGLGYGARLASRVLARPRAWQVLDVAIGLVMLAIAVTLAMG
jgi:L-lysine exporter family protein LysE/ArgO